MCPTCRYDGGSNDSVLKEINNGTISLTTHMICTLCGSVSSLVPSPLSRMQREGVWTNVYRTRVAEECMSHISSVRE